MKWIKHDTDANQDAKLQNVLLDYGLEGYGLYWYCVELIAGKVDKNNITFELEHDARIIARNTGSTAQKVEELMKYFVSNGLFENSQGVVTCLKLAKRLDQSMTSNADMRNIIQSIKSHDSIMTKSEKPMQDKNRSDKNRTEQTRTDEIKELPAIAEESVFKLPTNKADVFYLVTIEEINKYKETYQAVDIEQQYKAIISWLSTNPKNRKTKSGMPRFINSWLSRSQNSAPRVAVGGNQYSQTTMQNIETFKDVELD